MGVTWGAAWFAAGLVPRWVFGFNADAPFPLVFGVLGFMAGLLLAAIFVRGASLGWGDVLANAPTFELTDHETRQLRGGGDYGASPTGVDASAAIHL